MVVFTPGWRTKRSGRSGFGSTAAEARLASWDPPQPAAARQPTAIAATRSGRTPKRLPAAAEQAADEAAADEPRLALDRRHDRRHLRLAGHHRRRSRDERLARRESAEEGKGGDDHNCAD